MSPLAGIPSSGASWSLAQWGIPLTLRLNPQVETVSPWKLENSNERVEYYASKDGRSNVYELAQAGPSCDNEMDLFMGDDYRNGFTTSSPLASLGSINVRAGLNVVYQLLTPTCKIGTTLVNQATYVYSLILSSNDSTKKYPQQTLFYQIDLGNSAGVNNMSWCPSYEISNSSTDGTLNAFCLDDDVTMVNGTSVVPGATVMSSLEILPRMLEILHTNHSKAGVTAAPLDPNPSDWTVTSVYLGNIMNGNVVDTARWFNFGLSTMPGGTFCSNHSVIQWSCANGPPIGPGWVYQGNGCYQRVSGLTCNAA
jgi:hypothetical protein